MANPVRVWTGAAWQDLALVGAQGPAGAAGVGVPAGGATGQVLTKTNSADNATAWQTPAAGGGSYLPLAGGTLTGAVLSNLLGVASVVLDGKAGYEPYPRFRLTAEGTLNWGPADNSFETYLRRAGMNLLSLEGDFQPDSNNWWELGKTGRRWKKLWATDADFTNTPVVGGSPLLTRTVADGLYAPTGALTQTTADLRYLQLTGGALSGALSIGATPAAAGSLRLPNTATVSWRNAGNTADYTFGVNASNNLASTTHLVASSTNALDLGLLTTRWRSGFFGTTVSIAGASATTNQITHGITTDAQPRLAVDGNGQMKWGPGGSTAYDTILQRTGTKLLQTDAEWDNNMTLRTGANYGFRHGADNYGTIIYAKFGYGGDGNNPRMQFGCNAWFPQYGGGARSTPVKDVAGLASGVILVEAGGSGGAVEGRILLTEFIWQDGGWTNSYVSPMKLYHNGAIDLAGDRPVIKSKHTTGTVPARFGQVVDDNLHLTTNARYNGTTWLADDAAKGSVTWIMDAANNPFAVYTAPAGSPAAWVARLVLNSTGGLALSPNSGAYGLTVNGSPTAPAFLAAAGGSMQWNESTNNYFVRMASGSANSLHLSASVAGGLFGPATDNAQNLGGASNRWGTVFAVAPAINTSSIKAKDPRGDLDPEQALAAVLRTPTRRFTYKGMEQVFSGYYMEEADPLFTIGPDQTSAGNDVGILLGAIQALCARLGITP